MTTSAKKCKAAAAALGAHQIPFETYNDGQHIRVVVGEKVFNYWPSTGKTQSASPGKARTPGVYGSLTLSQFITKLTSEGIPA